MQLRLPKKIQDGIFYDSLPQFKRYGNHSFAILFFRVLGGFDSKQVIFSLKKIWNLYGVLKKGHLGDIPNCRVPAGDISVLMGYGPEIFKIPGVKKIIPRDFEGKQFQPAIIGRPILQGCGINYSDKNAENLGTSEHITIQIVSKTQLATYRAIVETWKLLDPIDNDNICLQLTKFYTGFQRDDDRSWLGFHDEVSNLRDTKERKDVISINRQSNRLKPDDFWTENGTYMAFLRTEIHLDVWNRISRTNQELIVGRHKSSGSPIVGIDKKGKPIIFGNFRNHKPSEYYDSKFHEHPDYLSRSWSSNKTRATDIESSRNILSQSHIGRTRHISDVSVKDPTSRRIYRQGFEFVDPPPNGLKSYRAGLNFISFQNDPNRLFFILTDPRWMGRANFGGSPELIRHNILSVISAGMFFVPAKEKPFPGASIFS